MPKVKYLTEDKSGKKLRRNVPEELQELAGKTAWVERVSGSSKDLREKANVFAVQTDSEIRSFRNRLAQTNAGASSNLETATGFKVHLTKTDAKRLALLYFQQQEEERLLSRIYSAGRGDAEIIADAAADYSHALRAAADEYLPGEPPASDHSMKIALRLLVSNYFLADDAIERRHTGRLSAREQLIAPAWLNEDRNFMVLCRLVEEAEVELARRRLEYLQTGVLPKIQNEFFLSNPPGNLLVERRPVENAYTIADLAAAFEKAKAEEGVSGSRQSQYRIVLRSLDEELGPDFALRNLSRKNCESLLALYLRTPSHATQHYPGMTLRASAEAFEKEKGGPANRYDAANKNLAILKSIFDFAVELDWREDNPTEKVALRIPREEKKRQARNKGYEPFTVEELQRIFNAPLYTGSQDDDRGAEKPGPNVIKRHRYWVPLIGLYSGMRAGEILQLGTADIKSSASGVTYFDVNDDPWGEDVGVEKRLKNENARRKVPMHPELKRLGFLEYVRCQSDERLFPEAPVGSGGKLSDHFSKRFAYFLKKREVWIARKKVFHSFRGTFADCLKEAEVPWDMREAIMGWEPSAKMDARYGSGYSIELLSDQVAKSSYPELDLSQLYPKN